MKILIFGGTAEGRRLSEWCAENGVFADVSVTTDYGARLLGNSGYVNVFTGRLDSREMAALTKTGAYAAVVDATHPYAVEATANIKAACELSGARYYRLLRDRCIPCGRCVGDMGELTALLDSTDKTILSTLGSKELPELAKLHCKSRIWLRVLPADGIEEQCCSYGFERSHIITGKGPFTVDENISHIRQSGAEILVTKESGAAGGYPEKMDAARECGIETVTLTRPAEEGHSFDELLELLKGKL